MKRGHRHRDQRGGGAESGNYSEHQIVTCTAAAAAAAVPFVQLSSRWQLGCCTFCLCVCLKIDVPGFVFMMFVAGAETLATSVTVQIITRTIY